MIITGIEVIRDNPRRRGIPRSDIERAMSHYGITEEEYLAHPDWYPLPERGSGLDVAVGVLPGQPIELTYGDKLRVGASFDYQGPAMQVTLHGAIGVWHPFPEYMPAAFDEIIAAENPISLPDSLLNFVPVTGSLEIPIAADIAPGEKYDLYVKIKEEPGAGMPRVDDVITITGIPPTFELLEETIYPYAYIYDGPHDGGIFTFKTDLFTPADWVAGRLAAACEDEVRKAGGKMLEMRVYVDKSPLLWTDWRIEVISVPPKTTPGVAMSLGIVWWAIAILAVLAIVLIIVLTWAAKEIAGLFKRNPALKDVKPAWTKETLIKTIQDAEEYWERTPTPVETLEGMSEEELREHLDKIAEEEVTPAPGLGLAIAAVGILGLGALALGAYAMSQPKEKKRK